MLEFLDAIPADYRPLAVFVFVVAGAIGSAIAFLRGKANGPETPKVQEFTMAGQLYDMGPVKELVEQTGLLFQQQVRTNIALEAVSVEVRDLVKVAAKATDAYTDHLQEVEIEEEVERRLKLRRTPTRS